MTHCTLCSGKHLWFSCPIRCLKCNGSGQVDFCGSDCDICDGTGRRNDVLQFLITTLVNRYNQDKLAPGILCSFVNGAWYFVAKRMDVTLHQVTDVEFNEGLAKLAGGILDITWKTGDSRIVAVKDMTNDHLLNAINYLERKAGKQQEPIDHLPNQYHHMVKEAKSRGLI